MTAKIGLFATGSSGTELEGTPVDASTATTMNPVAVSQNAVPAWSNWQWTIEAKLVNGDPAIAVSAPLVLFN